jgi:hypothetical protein
MIPYAFVACIWKPLALNVTSFDGLAFLQEIRKMKAWCRGHVKVSGIPLKVSQALLTAHQSEDSPLHISISTTALKMVTATFTETSVHFEHLTWLILTSPIWRWGEWRSCLLGLDAVNSDWYMLRFQVLLLLAPSPAYQQRQQDPLELSALLGNTQNRQMVQPAIFAVIKIKGCWNVTLTVGQ